MIDDVLDVMPGRFVRVSRLDDAVSAGVKIGSVLKVLANNEHSPDFQFDLKGVECLYVRANPAEFDLMEVNYDGWVVVDSGGFRLPKNFTCLGGRAPFTGKVNGDGVDLLWSQRDGHSDTNSTFHKMSAFIELLKDGALTDVTPLIIGKYKHEDHKVEADSQAKKELTSSLGVYRPELEDRKVGKVRVELVDFGFPNALWQVAQVMTWAQEAKGYKDHDWKNLPDAKNAFPAAASRHRMKHIMAVVGGQVLNEDGVTGEGYTDEESKYFHKAHEAFNILCELELMATGLITTKK